MRGFLLRTAIVALGLWLATELVDGLRFDGPGTLLIAALLLGIVNAVIRPVAVILTLPITFLTLGVFLAVINAAMLGLVASFLDGFRIDGFWPALWGAVIVSLTSWVGSGLISDKGKVEVIETRRQR